MGDEVAAIERPGRGLETKGQVRPKSEPKGGGGSAIDRNRRATPEVGCSSALRSLGAFHWPLRPSPNLTTLHNLQIFFSLDFHVKSAAPALESRRAIVTIIITEARQLR